MKRWITAGGLFLAALSPAAAPAATGQTVRGGLLVPTPEGGCGGVIGEHGRSRYGFSPVETVYEFSFDLDAGTRGAAFELRWDHVPGRDARSAPTATDLDIDFFDTGWREIKRFARRDFAIEKGTVPARAAKAAVCIYLGAVADFEYRAGSHL